MDKAKPKRLKGLKSNGTKTYAKKIILHFGIINRKGPPCRNLGFV